MRMSKESYDRLNALTAMCFNANAVFDNLAYALDYHYYANISKVVHLHVAHIMPEWADIITDKMIQLSARPVRQPIGGYDTDFESLHDVFVTMLMTLTGLRETTRSLIESADLDGDDEVRIFAEEFLMIISPYIKQAEEWVNASDVLSAQDFNIHVLDYTHFIPLDN
ncbi:MAG: hypothetical protein J6S67_07510 [Methanobrevibacter sp.]|nr:hypothetical protein [Methanobrevibacter sp.]